MEMGTEWEEGARAGFRRSKCEITVVDLADRSAGRHGLGWVVGPSESPGATGAPWVHASLSEEAQALVLELVKHQLYVEITWSDSH
jgi:hypothetical protein